MTVGFVSGAAVVTGISSAQVVTCYDTARDATYNTPGCYRVRHWVTRSSIGSVRYYGSWVGARGVSSVVCWIDWKSSGTQQR